MRCTNWKDQAAAWRLDCGGWERGSGGEPPGRERQARIAGSDGGEKRVRAAGDGEGEGAPSTVHPPV